MKNGVDLQVGRYIAGKHRWNAVATVTPTWTSSCCCCWQVAGDCGSARTQNDARCRSQLIELKQRAEIAVDCTVTKP